MPNTIKHVAKLCRIGWTLARHDALFFLSGTKTYSLLSLVAKRNSKTSQGERLRLAFENLGPAFIKLGQTLSMRPDLLDDDIIAELTLLQDNISDDTDNHAIETIEATFGRSINNLYKRFDSKPVAIASIAQVHKATTTEVKSVAVKILRPNIREQFTQDIEFFYWLAKLAPRFMPQTERLRPTEMVKILEDSVRFELDLRYEAATAEEMRSNAKTNKQLTIPEIDWARTNEHVLTLEWVDGISLNQPAALKDAGHDTDDIVKRITQAFFTMVFQDGLFHADMHAGNLIVKADGSIAAVDFGIFGQLDLQERIYLAEIFHGFIKGDYRQVAEAHIHAGYVPADTNIGHFTLACRAIAQPIMGRPLNEISGGNMLAQLFRVTETFNMQAQPQLLLLQKSLILIEGIGHTLAPNANLWELAEPPIRKWMEQSLSPAARAKYAADATAKRLRRLPEMLDKLERVIDKLAS